MYKIYADNVEIYNDGDANNSLAKQIINPKLELEDSAAGSLEITLPIYNTGYSTINLLTTDIKVTRNGEEIWWGRPLSESKDFYNNRTLTCEGALAFLNDVAQPLNQYENITLRTYTEYLIQKYNERAVSNRQFRVGAMPSFAISDLNTYTTNYEKTIELINKIVADRNLHLRVTKVYNLQVDGGFFTGYLLDFLEDYPTTSTQTIEFGVNLLDFTRNWTTDEFATVIIPLGERLDESRYEGVDERLTIAEVNSGSIYLESQAITAYGRIEKVVEFNGVTAADQLKAMGQVYLSDIQFETMEIELSAVDMNYFGVQYQAIKLLDKVRAVSVPHNMNRYFPVRKMSIPLDNPENTTFTLGDTQKASLTTVNNHVNQELIEAIKSMPPKTELLDAARANAAEIMNMATTGYITIHQGTGGADAIYISDTPDYTQATKYWKWSANGLAYWKDGDHDPTIAITMDGGIVGSFITAGSISADKLSSVYKDSVTGAIQTLSNDVDGLSLSVEGIDGRVESLEVTMQGVVFRSNLTDGVTQISGDNITTGMIKGRDLVLYQSKIDQSGSILDDGGHIQFVGLLNDSPYTFGRLLFDNNGAGSYESNQRRIYLVATNGVALKLFSGAGMSLEASQGMYLYAQNGHMQINSNNGDILLSTSTGNTGYLNGSAIITAANIGQYAPAAVFG